MSNIKDVKAYMKLVNEAVDAVIQMKSSAELKKTIADDAKEKFDVSTKEFNKAVALAYQQRYDSEKYQADKEMIETVYALLEDCE